MEKKARPYDQMTKRLVVRVAVVFDVLIPCVPYQHTAISCDAPRGCEKVSPLHTNTVQLELMIAALEIMSVHVKGSCLRKL